MNHPTHRSRPPARLQRGFTLVELITVILILGVLAAVAIPRYTDLQTQARAAKVAAIAGSIKSASGLVKATAMATAVSCSTGTGTSVTMEGTSIALNYCYPQALGSFTTGILAAANVSAADDWAIDGTNGGGATAGTTVQINLSGAGTPANCSIGYASAASANAMPAITTTTSGC